MRWPAAGALACALAALMPAVADARAVIAFLPPGPGETRPLLEELAARGMAVGMTSPTVGGFKQRQMGLDMSQGTRIPTRLYSKRIGSLVLRDGRLTGWDVARRRAEKAPGDLRPGLLGATVERGGLRVVYLDARGDAGRGPFPIGPIVGADERGGVRQADAGAAGERADLLVIDLPPGGAGLRALDQLLQADTDFVYVVRAPYGDKLRLLPSGIRAPGIRGELRSATTRRDGLIAATDVAPTVLQALDVEVPDDMQGEPIEGTGAGGAAGVQDTVDRLVVVTPRRGDALRWIVGSWLLLLVVLRIAAGDRGLRAALRIGFLGVLWLPGIALVTAGLAPTRLPECAVLGIGALALGSLTDRFVRWPVAPAVPAALVFAAHAVDLARGSQLIGASIAGPNPAGGARFFGIGNELEALLSLSVLLGTGALLTWRGAARAPLVFGLAALGAAAIMGAGRLGADVGAVITLGAGGAAAVVASLATAPSRRVIGLAVAAPVAAILLLVLLDVVTGGGAHLTRSVLDANGSGDLLDVARRRFEGSFSSLKKPGWAAAFVVAVVAVAWLAANRRRFLEAVPRPFAGGLVGAWFATVVGAISNDSGPLILEIGAIVMLLAAAYARGAPNPPVDPAH